MANTEHDVTKTDGSPESTWGASEEAKAKWDRKYGKAARRESKETSAAEKDEETK